MEDLEKATHVHRLPRRETITVNLDYRQTGIGGDDGWGARPHDEYTLHAKPYAYRFRLRGYAPSSGPLDDVARRPPPE
jgi:beta-galactosidase